MPTFSADQLLGIGMRMFTAVGVQESIARQVVQSLILSNLLGVDSHGFARIPNYLHAIKVGWIVPDAKQEVLADNGVVMHMDGHNAVGQIVATQAMRLAIQKAKEHAIGAVSFTRVYHIGRLGEYAALAAEEGAIGLVIANGSTPGGIVAPFGGRQRMMGTNPISFSIPAGSCPALVADLSTSVVAEGRVRIAMTKGEKVPLGWVIDREGHPTTNPADLYNGGAILCFGDHKGFALSLMVEVLGGILSGANVPISPDYERMQNGVFILVIDPRFFREMESYRNTVDLLFSTIKQVLPAHGTDGALIPGEPEQRHKSIREKSGIPIEDNTWTELQDVARALNVDLP